MSSSPTTRSLKEIRSQGYKAQVVERWNPYGRVRVDLFGFIDIVAIKEDTPGALGVQTTSLSNLPARYNKILDIPESKIWLIAGNRIEIHGWVKKGEKGKRKIWQVKVRNITLDDFRQV